jgi:hypothetical protein
MRCLLKKHKSIGGDVACNQKNPVVAIRLGGNEAKLGHGSKRLGGFREGYEDVETKVRTCRSLPQLDGGVQQPQNGVCFHEGKNPNLSAEEQEEPNITMGTTQGTGW